MGERANPGVNRHDYRKGAAHGVRHQDERVRIAAAGDPYTPGNVFWSLARDESPLVRRALARNGAVDPSVLSYLAVDEDAEVRREVSLNPATPDSVKAAYSENTGRLSVVVDLPPPVSNGSCSPFGLVVTRVGRLLPLVDESASQVDEALAARLHAAFAVGVGEGLLELGGGYPSAWLPPAVGWWRDCVGAYLAGICCRDDDADFDIDDATWVRRVVGVDDLVKSAPASIAGGHWLTDHGLLNLLRLTGAALIRRAAEASETPRSVLAALHSQWAEVGRVYFNLAENPKDAAAPFAFMASWSVRLAPDGIVRHVPYSRAIAECTEFGEPQTVAAMLRPVQQAADKCGWLRAMLDASDIGRTLRWTVSEAGNLLADIEKLADAGIVVRMPKQWRNGRPARPVAMATIGTGAPSRLGLGALLDFKASVTVDGVPLSEAEITDLLAGDTPLVRLGGRWIEVDRDSFRQALRKLTSLEKRAAGGGLTFVAAMREMAGVSLGTAVVPPGGAAIAPGPWLAERLRTLRSPDAAACDPGAALKGTLRPYQRAGVHWLRSLAALGLGACLADDMGLGKTIQVLSALLIERAGALAADNAPPVSLLVVPPSLLLNWVGEARRFAPGLRVLVAHPSMMPATDILDMGPRQLVAYDLVITSYGSLLRFPSLTAARWRFVILDEAQAIKNPDAKQTQAVKELRGDARVALTGTPIENRLLDLWSIFDFINPGLLGTSKQFADYTRGLAADDASSHARLRELVAPYILRRMKTDKAVIADLPDKVEMPAYCSLSPRQTALYSRTVDELAASLRHASQPHRRGKILGALLRLKMVCNHPSHALDEDGDWLEADSGKLACLREIAEAVAEAGEKLLVFTQFRQATDPLARFLASVFGHEGLVLHGQTPVSQRQPLVDRFQSDPSVPFFVLSLKAAGRGLTLTAASHVVHFDRWWNPAVEDQASDRAYRIGQHRNVLVRKLISRGTIEDRIDDMIEAKKALSDSVLSGRHEIDLTALGDDELLRLVSLDLTAATAA